MADYDWFDRDYSETDAEKTAKIRRSQGFIAVWKMDGWKHSRTEIEYYLCRRGCGCMVWDVDAHMNNVCREFNPAVL